MSALSGVVFHQGWVGEARGTLPALRLAYARRVTEMMCLRRAMRYWAITCGMLFLVACHADWAEIEIAIPGTTTTVEAENVAKKLVTPTMVSQLREEVSKSFPDVADRNLGTISMRWQTTRFTSFTGKGTGATTSVFVGVDPTGMSPARVSAVLSLCGHLIVREVGATASHRSGVES